MPTLGQDFLDNLGVEDLGQVLADERELLGCVCGRHGALLVVCFNYAIQAAVSLVLGDAI